MDKSAKKIGIFDSGIGGFSILSEILRKGIPLEIDYISDDAYAPYGGKSDSDIIARSLKLTQILLDRRCSLIVVACNTATAAAIAALRREYQNTVFVGVEPYINVLNQKTLFPEIRKAAVITTELTGNSEKFSLLKKRIDPDGNILHYSMPKLAAIVEDILESGLNRKQQIDLTEELKPLKSLNLSHLILGCTHYPLISDLIERELDVVAISTGPYVANRVCDVLKACEAEFCKSFCYLSTRSMQWETKSIADLTPLLRYSSTKLKTRQ